MDTSQFLSNVAPFRQLTPDQLVSLSRSYRNVILSTGAVLIEQGQPVEHVGIIQTGRAKVTVVDRSGNELLCGYLNPGDMVFDVAVLTGAVANASVISLEPTACLVQTHGAFIETIETNLPLKTFFYQNTALGIRWGYEAFCGRCMSGLLDEPCCAFCPPFVRKALDYIDNNFRKPITLEMVASETAMSKFHFSRLFKQHVGLSFKQYLNRKRIQTAKILISQRGYNVTEASFAVGFNDASYFSRVFREMEGRSPKRFLVNG